MENNSFIPNHFLYLLLFLELTSSVVLDLNQAYIYILGTCIFITNSMDFGTRRFNYTITGALQ